MGFDFETILGAEGDDIQGAYEAAVWDAESHPDKESCVPHAQYPDPLDPEPSVFDDEVEVAPTDQV
jgi:hypothetical protein